MAQRGSYQTKVKSKIMEYLKAHQDKAVSASDIISFLTSEGYSTNPTTVYRFLAKLCQEKELLKYPDIQGDKSTYQYVDPNSDCTDHLHIKCVKCGALDHLDCEFMDEFQEHLIKEHGFKLQCENNLLYGICKKCAKNQKSNP